MGELIEIPKRVTWTSKIVALEVGGEPLKVLYSMQKVLAPLIATSIKLKYPKRVYKTYKETDEEVDYLRIKRTK